MILLDQRKIGIEIEAESNGITSGAVSKLLQGPMSSGLWVLDREGEGSLRAGTFGWEIKTSGAGRTVREVRASMHELYPIMQGSSGNWRAAIHTHVSMDGLQGRHRGLLLALCYCVDDSFFAIYSPERRESNFCVPLANDTYRTLNAARCMYSGMGGYGEWCKYTSVNINAYNQFGTYEFRHMKTPRASNDLLEVQKTLLNVWDYAHTCVKLVDYVYRCTQAEWPLSKVLAPETVMRNTGLTVDKARVYGVIESLTSASPINSVDHDLLSMYAVVPKPSSAGLSESWADSTSWADPPEMEEPEDVLTDEEQEAQDDAFQRVRARMRERYGTTIATPSTTGTGD